jgi:hypothetical protein
MSEKPKRDHDGKDLPESEEYNSHYSTKILKGGTSQRPY